MSRMVFVTLLCILAAVAWADRLALTGLDGGGAFSSGGNLRLTGHLGPGPALPASAKSQSTGGTVRLNSGFYPSALASADRRNAADPAWLLLAAADADPLRGRPWLAPARSRDAAGVSPSLQSDGWLDR